MYGGGALAAGGAAYGAKKALGKKKESAAPLDYVRHFYKQAEDALNPAKLSSPSAAPPDSSASEEGPTPSQPSDVTSQAKLVGSNDSAINYTKGQAKADPKKDVNQVLAQPALSKTHDPVLHKVLDNTAKAGVKISMVQNAERVKAARALLSNLMDKQAGEKKKKEKESMAPTSPAGASGFAAQSAGMAGGGSTGGY
jgi:hypothetical protein